MESLLQYIQHVDPFWAYCLLFVSAFVENIFPPIPGDTVTVIGAYLVGREILNFWGVFISTTLGSIFGFMAIFLLAYWLEWKFLERFHPKWAKGPRIARAEKWLHKYGYWVVLFNRFLSGARSVISIVAGLSKLKMFRVFLMVVIGCAIWNGVLIYIGSAIGKNWHQIVYFIKLYNRFILGALFLMGLSALFYYLFRRKKAVN